MDRVNRLMVMMISVAVFMAAPVAAPPALPTELDANLLNLDGSNIDVNLPLTVCYTDGDLNPQCEDSVTGFPPGWTWNIYLGKSNFFGLVPGKDGTNITLTVDGYEPANVTAVEDTFVSVTLNLAPVPPGVIRTAEFNTVMTRAIAKNREYANKRTATVLYTALNDGDPSTSPLVVDLRTYPEYAAGHVPGAINIYYRDLGKDGAIAYLDSVYNNHILTGKQEIVVYGNTRHLSMMVLAYLRELGKPYSTKTFQLSEGFAGWTANETVAPGRFKECTSFNSTTGKGIAPANCNTNNFPTTIANPINNTDGTHGGLLWAEVNTGGSTIYEIIQRTWDARFGDMSRPDYEMTAAELYDLLDDNQDGVVQGVGDDLSNDPYILSNRGTTWTSPFPIGPYYTAGHIPSSTAVDWAWAPGGATRRQELRSLDRSDFLPADRTIVHHCWVGVSQQYGGFWYNALNYTVVSLDWGTQGWTKNKTVRGTAGIKPNIIYPQPGDPDDYPFNSIPSDTTLPSEVNTTVVQRLDYMFNVTWTTATDSGSGLREYRIYQRLNGNVADNTLIGTVFAGYGSSPSQPYVAGPGYDDGNLYQFKVVAVDNAGNEGNGAYAPPDGPVPPIPFAPLGTLAVLGSGLVAYAYNRRRVN